MNEKVSRARLAKAALVVAFIVLVVPVADALWRSFPPAEATASSSGGIESAALVGDATGLFQPDAEDLPGNIAALGASGGGVAQAFEALERIEDAASAGGGEIPESFSREIGFPAQSHDWRADSSGAVFGCIAAGAPEEVSAAIERDLSERGWAKVDLGGLAGATYVKDEGACAWVLVTCTQVGDSTSVVYRCVYR